MARYEVFLNDDVRDWIDSRVSEGRYPSADAYLETLVRHDIEANGDEAVERLRAAIDEGLNSGVSDRSLEDIWKAHIAARNAA